MIYGTMVRERVVAFYFDEHPILRSLILKPLEDFMCFAQVLVLLTRRVSLIWSPFIILVHAP